jgi:hypothetical protein
MDMKRLIPLAAFAFAGLIAPAATAVAHAEPAAGTPLPALKPVGTYEGFGEGLSVTMADLDGKTGDEIVLGGRGVAVFDEKSFAPRRPLWSYHWDEPKIRGYGGDNTLAYRVQPLRVGARTDLLVTSSDNKLIRLDGRTGREVWVRDKPFGLNFTDELAQIDADHDGVADIFPNFSNTAFSGATGRPIWTAKELPADRPPTWVVPAELDGRPGADLLVAVEPERCVDPTSTAQTDRRLRSQPQSHRPDPAAQRREYAEKVREVFGQSAGPAASCTPPPRQPELFAYSGSGQLLWKQMPTEPIWSLAAADLDGDGRSEALIGEEDGHVSAYSTTGVRSWRADSGQAVVSSVVGADTNGDGRPEVYASHGDKPSGGAKFAVASFGPDGKTLRSWPVPGLMMRLKAGDIDGDGRPELLAAVQKSAGTAAVLAFDPKRQDDRPAWESDAYLRIGDLAVGQWQGQPAVTIGADDTILRGVWGRTGKPAFDYLGGGWITGVATGPLGTGTPEGIAHTDHTGQVAVSAPDGRQLWRSWLGGGDSSYASGVLVADTTGDGHPEVIAGGYAPRPGADGIVRAYTWDGKVAWTASPPGWIDQIVLAQLDGKGPKEIVAGTFDGSNCGVAAIDGRTGKLLWHRQVTDCMLMSGISAGDSDNDGRDEIGFASSRFEAPGTLALLEPTGKIRWTQTSPRVVEDFRWTAVTRGGFYYGGGLDKASVRNADAKTGKLRWQGQLATAGTAWESDHYTVVPDRNRDGIPEIAISVVGGEVGLYDGAKGRLLFRTRVIGTEGDAGPLTVVQPRTGDPVLAVTETGGRIRTKAHLISLAGRIVATTAAFQQGDGAGIAPLRLPGGETGLTVGAGLSVYTYSTR